MFGVKPTLQTPRNRHLLVQHHREQGLEVASFAPRFVRKIELMSQEEPGKSNFAPTDGAPRGIQCRESHRESWNYKHPAWGAEEGGEILVFINHRAELMDLGRFWGEFGKALAWWDPAWGLLSPHSRNSRNSRSLAGGRDQPKCTEPNPGRIKIVQNSSSAPAWSIPSLVSYGNERRASAASPRLPGPVSGGSGMLPNPTRNGDPSGMKEPLWVCWAPPFPGTPKILRFQPESLEAALGVEIPKLWKVLAASSEGFGSQREF